MRIRRTDCAECICYTEAMAKDASHIGVWLAVGAGAGVAIGTATDQLALWIALGAGIGICIGAALTGLKK